MSLDKLTKYLYRLGREVKVSTIAIESHDAVARKVNVNKANKRQEYWAWSHR